MTGILEGIAIGAAVSLAGAGITYALTPTQKIDSGRINDLSVPKTAYGAALPWAWGKVRLGGNLIWSGYLEEIRKEQDNGRKGKQVNINYSYFGNFAVVFCECPFRPVADYPRAWFNKKLVYSKVGGAETIAEGGKFASSYLSFYYGGPNQSIDPLIANLDAIASFNYGIPTDPTERAAFLAALGNPGDTCAYRRRAYMVAQRLPLGDFFNSLPGVEAEVLASVDCTLGQIIGDIFGLFFEPSKLDLSLINAIPVRGFFINSVEAAKSAIQALQKAYFFDIVQSGGKFRFVPLTAPRPVINLNYTDLAAHQSGSERPQNFEINQTAALSLPSELSVTYLDSDKNYDSNQVTSRLQVKEYQNKNTVSVELPLGMWIK